METRKPSILLGVTGCIAAYKSCEIVRGLQKASMDVTVMMTENATRFVGSTTFNALTNHPVLTGLFEDPTDPIPHITHAEACDLFLIAPCTANVLAKIAHGIADDLVTSTALAVTAPLVLAPAMNMHMYENPVTQANIAQLRGRGVIVLDAASGYQACGDVGPGRLQEPDAIVAAVKDILAQQPHIPGDATENEKAKTTAVPKLDLAGKRVMVTAGPTQEPIDAVRFISNYSSGKMGYALAQAAVDRGAEVTLISGPVTLEPPRGVRLIPIQTAREMLTAAESEFPRTNIAICAAAVADYRPEDAQERKLKKGQDDSALQTLHLVQNPDILAALGHRKQPGQVVVGFAAETDSLITSAKEKLSAKNADFIVANEVGKGKAFGTDDDQASLVMESEVIDLPLMAKQALADRILDQALSLCVPDNAER